MPTRHRTVNFSGRRMKVLGAELTVGDHAPDAVLHAGTRSSATPSPWRSWNFLDPEVINLADYRGRLLVLSSIPTLEISSCARETMRWEDEGKSRAWLGVLSVSMDLPQAQARWCAANGVGHLVASAHMSDAFARDYGLLIEETRLLQRATFVIDATGVIQYAEYMKDIEGEPDYAKALSVVAKLSEGAVGVGARVDSQNATYERLRDAIIHGELHAGAQIPEESLTERLGVSRTPLRAAINRLEAEGLVKRAANRRLFVTPVSIEDARQLYGVRIALEELALMEAAEASLEGLLAAMRECLDRMEDAERHRNENVAEGGRAFHAAIFKASGNAVNEEVLQRLLVRVDRYRYIGTGGGRRRQTQAVQEHRAVFEALLRNDVDAARRALREHLERARDEIIEVLRPVSSGESSKVRVPPAGKRESA
jgi:thiol peroxidase